MGVIDDAGRAVSFIQSIYHEFGSGIVLPGSGVNWQNRGCSFSLDPAALNALSGPFHVSFMQIVVFRSTCLDQSIRVHVSRKP